MVVGITLVLLPFAVLLGFHKGLRAEQDKNARRAAGQTAVKMAIKTAMHMTVSR